MNNTGMIRTIEKIATPGKGILAADESSPTIAKRFKTINVESTEATRQAYRDLLFTAPKIEDSISGVILFEETLYQKSNDGTPFPELLKKRGIVPGIKVDKGLIPFESNPDEKITQGLDELPDRLAQYKEAGAQFAKWRAVYAISNTTPSKILIKTNAQLLARYAKICQNLDIVPIVEPEVLMDGSHDIQTSFNITKLVQEAVFKELIKRGVELETMILKPSMVIAGKTAAKQSSAEEVAEYTIKLFRETVPAAVPTINFLSGGQTPEQATENLKAINAIGPQPWNLSFSYGRALQEHCLKAWQGKTENKIAAQQALLDRAIANGAAALPFK